MDAVRELFRRDHFAHHSGIEMVSVSPGQAVARMLVRPHHLNGLGVVQGGAIFTLADFAFAAAVNGRGLVAVAIDVNIHYLKGPRGGMLEATAREVALNPRLGSYLVDVRDDAGELVATFQGLAYRKKETVESVLGLESPAEAGKDLSAAPSPSGVLD